MTHGFLILAVEEREIGTQLLDGLLSTIDRRATGTGELYNGLFALVQKSCILVVDRNHWGWACGVDGGSNEKHRKQLGLIGLGGQCKLTRHPDDEIRTGQMKNE